MPILHLVLSLLLAHGAHKTENVILVTYDGLRWQEVFEGADASLFTKEHAAARKAYGRDSAEERRAALLPFLWGTVAKQGQLYGNGPKGSLARVTNGKRFSSRLEAASRFPSSRCSEALAAIPISTFSFTTARARTLLRSFSSGGVFKDCPLVRNC